MHYLWTFILFILFLIMIIVVGRNWNNKRKASKLKHLSDDILKYFFDCEYRAAPCRLDGLYGHLHLPPQKIANGIGHLIEKAFIRPNRDNSFILTESGRKQALKIIRKHRLIERYLADETGTLPEQWHTKADRFEHFISDNEIENIVRRTGHPVFDPHGDPIPTESGEIPARVKEFSLLDLEEGQRAIINHIEDEPTSIFIEVTKMGLHPGLNIFLKKKISSKFVITSHLGESTLTPIQAGALNIKKEIRKKNSYKITLHTLNQIPIGQTMIIYGISNDLRGRQRRRLLDLGFVPGNSVTPTLSSSSKGTRAYEILNTLIALRSEQSSKIIVSPIQNFSEEE